MAFVPNTQTITIGNTVLTDLTNLIVLRAVWDANVAGRNSTARRANSNTNSSTGYAVTAGKTFKIYAIRIVAWGMTANSYMEISQTDNDCLVDSTTSPAGQVFPQGNASFRIIIGPSTTFGTIEHAWQWSIQSGKYLTFTNSSAATRAIVDVYGYEV